jgi:hypothetical protein
VRRLIEVMLVVAVVIDVAYWSIWFTHRGWLASEHTQAYYDFENAFPLADLWLGIAIVMALIALRTGRPSALFWLICSGAAGLYLGSLDLLYDLEHGIFARGAGGAIEAGIVALTWVFSLTLLRWSWTHRSELL